MVVVAIVVDLVVVVVVVLVYLVDAGGRGRGGGRLSSPSVFEKSAHGVLALDSLLVHRLYYS